jgi:hypothetical protein
MTRMTQTGSAARSSRRARRDETLFCSVRVPATARRRLGKLLEMVKTAGGWKAVGFSRTDTPMLGSLMEEAVLLLEARMARPARSGQ